MLLAPIFPGGASLGVILPLLMVADLFAVIHFRSRAHWHTLLRLAPPAFIGIVIGFFALRVVDPAHINRLIAAIIIVLLTLQTLRELGYFVADHVPHRWWFAWSLGLLAGFATMVANAAGPITVIFFLAMKFDKVLFMGTAAWYYFIFNWVKVPFQANLGLIVPNTLLIDLALVPLVLLGALLGIYALRRIPQKPFQYLALALAALASVRLLILG